MDDKLPLVRRGRRNARYTAISNDIIDHRTLSPEARIALIYLLSKPDDWQLQVNDVRRLLGTGERPCGRNKCYAVIKELKESAYVIAVEELCHGRFHRLTYYVFDEPVIDPAAFKQNSGVSAQLAKPRQRRASPVRTHRVPKTGKRWRHRVPNFGIPESGILLKTEIYKLLKLPPLPRTAMAALMSELSTEARLFWHSGATGLRVIVRDGGI